MGRRPGDGPAPLSGGWELFEMTRLCPARLGMGGASRWKAG
jgi:hypothetical protein